MTAHFSILWTGGIFIPASGPYAFATVSSDGSEIRIDGRVVADNGGAHGVEARTGTVDLVRGFHAIDVRHFQRTGAGTFEACWTPPGEARRELEHDLGVATDGEGDGALGVGPSVQQAHRRLDEAAEAVRGDAGLAAAASGS